MHFSFGEAAGPGRLSARRLRLIEGSLTNCSNRVSFRTPIRKFSSATWIFGRLRWETHSPQGVLQLQTFGNCSSERWISAYSPAEWSRSQGDWRGQCLKSRVAGRKCKVLQFAEFCSGEI